MAAQTGRTGHPIYIERVGQLDVDALLQITTVDRYIRCLHSASLTQITTGRVHTRRYHVQAYEDMLMHKLPACSLAAQKPVSQSMTILDLDVSAHWFDAFRNLFEHCNWNIRWMLALLLSNSVWWCCF